MSDVTDLQELERISKLISDLRNTFVPAVREKIEKHFQVPAEMEGDILKMLEFEGRKQIKINSGLFEIIIKAK